MDKDLKDCTAITRLDAIFTQMMMRFRAPMKDAYDYQQCPALSDLLLRVSANVPEAKVSDLVSVFASPTLKGHFKHQANGDLGKAFVHFINDSLAKTIIRIRNLDIYAELGSAEELRREVLTAAAYSYLMPRILQQSVQDHLPVQANAETGAFGEFMAVIARDQGSIDTLTGELLQFCDIAPAEWHAQIATELDRMRGNGPRLGMEIMLPRHLDALQPGL